MAFRGLNLKKYHFGVHLMFDGYGCPEETLNNMELVYLALDQLTADLGMKKLSSPVVVEAKDNGKKDPGGFSGFIVIAESHISIHTFDKRGFVSADVYSCKNFDTKKAIKFLNTTFKVKKKEVRVIVRGKGYPMKNIY